MDAAIATAAALNVVEPLMSGIGGDGFIMVHWKESDRIEICNGTGAAPYAATRERYLPEGIPTKGILSVSVPGLLDSWLASHEKYGRPVHSLIWRRSVGSWSVSTPARSKLRLTCSRKLNVSDIGLSPG